MMKNDALSGRIFGNGSVLFIRVSKGIPRINSWTGIEIE